MYYTLNNQVGPIVLYSKQPSIVGTVRAINGLLGANCSKATKFGPDVDRTLIDRFWVDAKKGIALRHRRG